MIPDSHFHLPSNFSKEGFVKELQKQHYTGEVSTCFPHLWDSEIAILKNSLHFSHSIGIHPEIVSQVSEKDLTLLKKFLLENPELSVGECGLDKRFENYNPKGKQEFVFRKQVQFAKELNRKIVIHYVGDFYRVLNILKEELPKDHPIYIHRYSSNEQATQEALYFKNILFGNPKNIKNMPLEKICYESDADDKFYHKSKTIYESVEQMIQIVKNEFSRIKRQVFI